MEISAHQGSWERHRRLQYNIQVGRDFISLPTFKRAYTLRIRLVVMIRFMYHLGLPSHRAILLYKSGVSYPNIVVWKKLKHKYRYTLFEELVELCLDFSKVDIFSNNLTPQKSKKVAQISRCILPHTKCPMMNFYRLCST